LLEELPGPDSANGITLPERIAHLCGRGIMPAQFRVADIRKYLGDAYAESYIRRALVLYSEKPGAYTYRWNKPRFRKVRHGLYEVVT
jgi:hypothetical protein